jgi:hypothetical protein
MVTVRSTPRKGFGLLDIMVAVAIAGVSIAAFVAGVATLGQQPTAAHDAYMVMQSEVASARELARTTGNGATIVVVPGTNSFTAQMYAGRPNGGTFNTTPQSTVVESVAFSSGIAGTQPLAIFFSASGSVAAANWHIGDGNIASQPACTSSITVSFTGGTKTVNASIGCSDPRLI